MRVSDDDGFFREVSEEVRQDRMFALWKRYGAYVIAVIVIVVAASAGANWLEHMRQENARETGGAMIAAENREDIAALVEELEGAPRALAEMRLAAAEAEAGDTQGAIRRYRAVADDAGLGDAYGDLARLHAARLDLPGLSPAAAEETLAPLIEPGRPYRTLALELRAAIRLNAGDPDGAREDVAALLGEPGLTPGLAARARRMLALIGPEEAPANGAGATD